jgi:hypothetical protein
MAKIQLNDREYLQSLRDEAENQALLVTNELWQRAYFSLADVVDRLDAMEARIISDEE